MATKKFIELQSMSAEAIHEELKQAQTDKKANKIEIKKAVESMFTTNVVAVNTVIVPARLKSRNTRSGVVRGSISAYKKAYVTLAAGEELDIYGTTEE